MKSPLTSTSNNGPALCDYCLGDVNRNKQGQCEDMLFCKDCSAKAHPSCMNYSKELAARAQSYPWQCIECKSCTICCSAQDGASILFCDGCDKAYHMKCHEPRISVKPEGKWICVKCHSEEDCLPDTQYLNLNGGNCENGNDALFNTSSTKHTNSRFHQQNEINKTVREVGNLSHEEEVPIPNCATWSSDKIAEYFTSIGFKNHAYVFTREEIDGKALLLLKRSDVISGLSLKLGPAVKIYEQIQKLQNASFYGVSLHNGI